MPGTDLDDTPAQGVEVAWSLAEPLRLAEARTAAVLLPVAPAGAGIELRELDAMALYTPPRTRSTRSREAFNSGFVPLPSLLFNVPRLLVEGEAGAGKTAFLRVTACALARRSWSDPHFSPAPARLLPVPALFEASVLAGVEEGEVSGFLAARLGGEPAVWIEALEQGRILFLVDDADEVAGGLRKRLLRVLDEIGARWPGCPIVVASRPTGVRDLRDAGFYRAALEPFGDEEVRGFAERWTRVTGSPAPEEVFAGRSGSLTRVPLLLAWLCALQRTMRRASPAAICHAMAERLFATAEPAREAAGTSREIARDLLADLALQLAVAGRSAMELGETGGPAVRLGLQAESRIGATLRDSGGDRVAFVHRLLGDHWAAVALARRLRSEAGQDAAWTLLRERLGDPRWQGIFDLLPARLIATGGSEPLLDRLLSLSERADPAVRAWALGCAGRTLSLAALEARAPAPAAEDRWRRALAGVPGLLLDPGIPAAGRIAAAEASGAWEDPGRDPLPGQLLPVADRAGWRLGRDPATVAGFSRFVEAGGYEERHLWPEEGWALREDGGWHAPGDWEVQLRTPSRPVVNVSWYEAAAFCRWLSERTGRSLSLPGSALWEAAARHPDGPYPWGDAVPDAERLNFDQNVGRATPVGVYPSGAAPGGHLDLGGNVWEWCADADASGLRAIRGGGWYSKGQYARADYVYFFHPGNRFHDLGFRLAEVLA